MRDDIERTRDHMSGTIDAIGERTSPRRIVGRQRRRLSDRVHHLRETVMGSAEDAQGSMQSVVDDLREAPEAMKRQTQGSPLAAGLIAFGAGALAAAVVPSSRTERRAASRLQEEARPAVEQLKEAGQDVAEQVKDSAQQAVEQVKSSAGESARAVAEEAKAAAQEVREPETGREAPP